MTYKLELFLVLKKKKKRLVNRKSFKNYVFFMVYLYWTSPFLHYINSFDTKIKKLRLDRTHVAKINSN